MTRPDFPLVWDNSMRSALVSCPRKFYLEYLEHFRSKHPNVDLHAGKAYASGLEVARRSFYVEGVSELESEARGLETLLREYGPFECPQNNPKTLARMAEAFAYYFMVFPMSKDPAQPYLGKNGPMIEFSFVYPLDDSLLHPVSGEPILYSGRGDMIATYAGAISIYDDKTTKSLGPQWGSSWDLRAQFTGYMWLALQYGIPVSQILVRGVSILKTKLDHQQAFSIREPWRIERWHGQVVRDIKRAIEMWKEGYWDYNESDACTQYSGCQFRQPCQSQDPAPWLEMYFDRKKWDPVSREELDLSGNPILLPTRVEEQTVGNISDFMKGRRK